MIRRFILYDQIFKKKDTQMDEALFHKFTQHSDLQAELLGTGDAELVEVNSMCFTANLIY